MPLEEKDMAASRLVLEAMGYENARIGDPISLTFSTDTGEISDTFTLSGIWDGDLAGYRQTILTLSSIYGTICPAGQRHINGRCFTGYRIFGCFA